jgi:hypothetical protein
MEMQREDMLEEKGRKGGGMESRHHRRVEASHEINSSTALGDWKEREGQE